MVDLGEIEIEITKTANGGAEYVQIRSPAAMPVNIVLIASKITVNDRRVPKKKPAKAKK